MIIPDVTIGKQIGYRNKYRFTFFNDTYFQLIFYHDIRTEEKYFTENNVRHYIGHYMYSILSDLETESYYKINGKYEFLIHYPELNGNNYNWWRQTLSPTIQTENDTRIDEDDHYVLGYENVSVHYPTAGWGGLSLTNSTSYSYINGNINSVKWHYAIGCYGILEKGIPGPSYIYTNVVALYAKINNLYMIRCISCKVYHTIPISNTYLYVFILM